MVIFPNAKINIGLQILDKRPDGYHNILSCLHPVNLFDVLEVNTQFPNSNFPVELNYTGLPIKGSSDDNLCIKAYRLLKLDFPDLPAVRFHLHKVIPSEAGLGGGSANASYTLKLLNKKFDLGLSEFQLNVYASQLGSDCPFFIKNTTSLARGRGEILEPVKIDLAGYKILLVKPNIHINTGEAFRKINFKSDSIDLKQALEKPVNTWKENIFNDFEKVIFPDHPFLNDLKKTLYKNGATYASMSGSGSTIYGIFEEKVKLDLNFPLFFSCWIK